MIINVILRRPGEDVFRLDAAHEHRDFVERRRVVEYLEVVQQRLVRDRAGDFRGTSRFLPADCTRACSRVRMDEPHQPLAIFHKCRERPPY